MGDKFDVLNHDKKFRYMLLSRLKMDCKYFLGYGNRCERHLWAGNVADHIEVMKLLYNSFSDKDKPEWLSWEEILKYEEDMK